MNGGVALATGVKPELQAAIVLDFDGTLAPDSSQALVKEVLGRGPDFWDRIDPLEQDGWNARWPGSLSSSTTWRGRTGSFVGKTLGKLPPTCGCTLAFHSSSLTSGALSNGFAEGQGSRGY